MTNEKVLLYARKKITWSEGLWHSLKGMVRQVLFRRWRLSRQ